jgi:hypothetical protein
MNKIQSQLQPFFSKYKVIRFKKNETVLRSDSIPPGVFFIKKAM